MLTSEAGPGARELLARGEFDEAISLLREKCRDHPQSGSLRMELARACSLAGRRRDTTEAYFDAVELGFRHPVLLSALGSSLFSEGRVQETVTACRAALARD